MATKREKWAPNSDAYREARLALLRVLTHQSFEGTDAAHENSKTPVALAKMTLREETEQRRADDASGMNMAAPAKAEVLTARALQTIDETDTVARAVEKAFSRFAEQHRN